MTTWQAAAQRVFRTLDLTHDNALSIDHLAVLALALAPASSLPRRFFDVCAQAAHLLTSMCDDAPSVPPSSFLAYLSSLDLDVPALDALAERCEALLCLLYEPFEQEQLAQLTSTLSLRASASITDALDLNATLFPTRSTALPGLLSSGHTVWLQALAYAHYHAQQDPTQMPKSPSTFNLHTPSAPLQYERLLHLFLLCDEEALALRTRFFLALDGDADMDTLILQLSLELFQAFARRRSYAQKYTSHLELMEDPLFQHTLGAVQNFVELGDLCLETVAEACAAAVAPASPQRHAPGSPTYSESVPEPQPLANGTGASLSDLKSLKDLRARVLDADWVDTGLRNKAVSSASPLPTPSPDPVAFLRTSVYRPAGLLAGDVLDVALRAVNVQPPRAPS